MTANEMLEIARKEIGTKRGSKTVKYNTEYYGYDSTASWCATFIWWCFKQGNASDLYYGGGKTAYVPTLMNYHKAQAVNDYQPGDIMFFDGLSGKFNGIADHVGICGAWDGTTITTIDGNTGYTSDANGGQVMRRQRNKKYILGAYRPNYEKKEESELTQDQFDKMMDNYLERREMLAAGKWSEDAISYVIEDQIMDGTRPKMFATREEVAQVAYNLKKYSLLDNTDIRYTNRTD